MKKIRNQKEILFIAGILAAALILWGILKFYPRGDYASIRITVAGKEYGVYSLSRDQDIPINDTNVCRIKNGQAFMIEANCPDHLCIRQSPIGIDGGSIICLPNKVVIEGESSAGSSQSETDANT